MFISPHRIYFNHSACAFKLNRLTCSRLCPLICALIGGADARRPLILPGNDNAITISMNVYRAIDHSIEISFSYFQT